MKATNDGKTAKAKTRKLNGGDWPRAVSVGSVSVKVYRRWRVDGARSYEVADYSEGSRRLRSFATPEAALDEAAKIARLLSSGDVEAAGMRNSEAAAFGRAVQLLRPTGLPLELAAADFARAFQILGGNKIVVAAEYYKRHAADTITARTVAEVVSEMLAVKEAKGRQRNTLAELRQRLTRFAEAFKVDIATITTPDATRWLDSLKVGERTRLNIRSKVGTLFTFAERRGYIPKGCNPVSGTEKPEPTEGEVTTYAPTEIEKLLTAASAEFRPCLALGAFAGLRAAEIQRLEWRDVDFGKGTITAASKKRGTPSRRWVPITDNLRAWLLPSARRTGFVWVPSEKNRALAPVRYNAALAETSTAAGVPWKHNALRHSFISYRVAEVQDVNRVALEAGNSPGVIFRHYRQLCDADTAKLWFGILPDAQAGNVIQLTAAQTK